jgi:uncharacterized Zn finger protein
VSDDFPRRWFPPSTPRDVKGGIRAHSRRGTFGRSWWARRWIGALEALELGGRLARGRAYARRGQVIEIAVEKGQAAARVQGSRREPYQVELAMRTLRGDEWGRVAAALAREARFAAALLAGEMPPDVEEAFRAAGVPLFPRERGDLLTSCSCPDVSNPCKHIAAVHYLLGEEFDRDPFLVFRLRGLDRDELIALVGAEPAAGPAAAEAAAPAAEPLPADPAGFWQGGPLPQDFPGEVQPPPATAALLGRLGQFPFWRGRDAIFPALAPVFQAASTRALDLLATPAPGSPARRGA